MTSRVYCFPVRLSVHFASSSEAAALLDSSDEVVEIDGAEDKEDLLRKIGDALSFPDYYALNWDAFDECLRERREATLIVHDAAALWTTHPAEMMTLVDVWIAAASEADGGLDLVFVL
jgi:RNAse (barnase) inhibitor barstar